MTDWTRDDAREAYSVLHWSGGYFDVSREGSLVACPRGPEDGRQIDLQALVAELHTQGLSLPVLVRFSDILDHRIESLCEAFGAAMAEREYTGRYTAVYPIKVNQQRSVVERMVASGGSNIGLEAGSKPELLAVLAHTPANGLVVCNGHKDREFIQLALVGQALGRRVYIVVERMSEVQLVIEEAASLGIMPLLGMRVRLSSIGEGKWQNTGGDKSKFGLSAAQVPRAIEKLRAAGLLPCLRMMHFHMGSQIANIRHIQAGMREAGRYYAALRDLGAPIDIVDVGGGLSVDYEGTRSRSHYSANYSLQEYANNVVQGLWEICSSENLPHPDIVTECGRAMTAHHAALITNVVDVEHTLEVGELQPVSQQEPMILQDMWQALQDLSRRNAMETWHDATYRLGEAQSLFGHGVLTLAERARAEQIYAATCIALRKVLRAETRSHRELIDELNDKLADKYFCNFSVFQSAPDVWAIQQIFPIAPLTRLNEKPRRRAVLVDLTCDSDGRIDSYVDGEGVESSLPLHDIKLDEPYLIGLFLVGAYQEILGDMHNLFGDTDSVHVELTDSGYRLTEAVRGDTVDGVLRYVHFQPEDLMARYERQLDVAGLAPAMRDTCRTLLAGGLEGYTYLED